MAERDADRRRQLTLAATILGSSVAFIDATVVVVALPTIERDLELGLSGQQWVFVSYAVALAALQLVGGAVGDRYGRRPTFIAGAAAFALASALAGAAPDEATLVVARALQGVAGAFLTTNSLALLRAVYGREAGRAVGLWTAFVSVATVAGPPVGGAVVEWTSWRWIFYVNLPLAALTIVLAVLGRCRETEPQTAGHLDLPGATLTAVGFGSLTYALVEGAENGFDRYWWALALAGASVAAFVWWERRTSEPMLPLDLFRRRNFAAANLETLVVYAGLSANLVFFMLYLQFLGFSPFEAGLLNVPTSVAMILLSGRVGSLADRYGPRLFLTVGPALLGAANLCFLLVDERSDMWTAGALGLALFSLGLGLMVAPITSTALSAAPTSLAGIASGVNQTVARVGGLLAVAALGVVAAVVFEASGGQPDAVPFAKGQTDAALRAASIDAFRAVIAAAAGLSFAGAAVAAIGISNDEAKADRSEAGLAASPLAEAS